MKLIVIMAAFVAWLGANSDLPTPEEAPIIRTAPAERVFHMYYPGQSYDPDSGDVVFAIYQIGDGTIYVADDVDLETAWGQSVILHELVHYYQDNSGNTYACLGDMEREAYQLQQDWLEEQGVNLFDHINGLFMIFEWQRGCERYRLPDEGDH